MKTIRINNFYFQSTTAFIWQYFPKDPRLKMNNIFEMNIPKLYLIEKYF